MMAHRDRPFQPTPAQTETVWRCERCGREGVGRWGVEHQDSTGHFVREVYRSALPLIRFLAYEAYRGRDPFDVMNQLVLDGDLDTALATCLQRKMRRGLRVFAHRAAAARAKA